MKRIDGVERTWASDAMRLGSPDIALESTQQSACVTKESLRYVVLPHSPSAKEDKNELGERKKTEGRDRAMERMTYKITPLPLICHKTPLLFPNRTSSRRLSSKSPPPTTYRMYSFVPCRLSRRLSGSSISADLKRSANGYCPQPGVGCMSATASLKSSA